MPLQDRIGHLQAETSPQAVRGNRFIPRLANASRACLPHVRRNFNS
jgi:hypothetical protein